MTLHLRRTKGNGSCIVYIVYSMVCLWWCYMMNNSKGNINWVISPRKGLYFTVLTHALHSYAYFTPPVMFFERWNKSYDWKSILFSRRRWTSEQWASKVSIFLHILFIIPLNVYLLTSTFIWLYFYGDTYCFMIGKFQNFNFHISFSKLKSKTLSSWEKPILLTIKLNNNTDIWCWLIAFLCVVL